MANRTVSNVSDGPSVVILSPNYTTIDLKEGQNLGPITCSAVCNPTCTILWRFNATVGDGRFVDQTTQNGVLHIVNVRYSMAGVYRCKAQNKISFKRRDVYLNVLCKYQISVSLEFTFIFMPPESKIWGI
ncbi:hypothetical protein FSP39_025404 [Pinctada imbricata]|uniref:Ig-like domain-containing protein n=1 Tax=Pinctada imbricata TaxID=66713 RepID=A0AA88Y117_PINIB|nr:hypothetical protein FSP39_025404 [Pinctada imbricata]